MENKKRFNKILNEKRFNKILKEMGDLYAKKNSDYGDSFKDTHERFGSVAGVIRINDKVNRLNNLVERESRVEDESFRDTLIDLANYAVMLIMEIDGVQDEQLELFTYMEEESYTKMMYRPRFSLPVIEGGPLKDVLKTFSEIDTTALTNDNKARMYKKEEEIKEAEESVKRKPWVEEYLDENGNYSFEKGV